MRKIYIPILVFLILSGVGLYVTLMPSPSLDNNNVVDVFIGEPAPFDQDANKLNFSEAIASYKMQGIKILLPQWLPTNLKPTVAYGGFPGIAVFLYSSQGYETIAKAELTIQVTFSDYLPFDPKISKGVFTRIGNYEAYYDTAAYEGSSEYRALYGPTCVLLVIRDGNTCYWLKTIPKFTINDLFRIAESMKVS